MVPSREEFDKCIRCLSSYGVYRVRGWREDESPDESAWIDQIQPSVFVGESKDIGVALLSRVFDELTHQRQEIHATAVMQWLWASAEYSRAYGKLFPGHFFLKTEDDLGKAKKIFVDNSYSRLRSAALDEDEHRFLFSSRRSGLLRDYDFMRWQEGFVSALREYFYTNSAEMMLERRRSFKKNVESGVEAVRALRKLADDPIFMHLFRRVRDGRNILNAFMSGDERGAEIEDSLSEISKFDPGVLYPIGRLDATAKARVFVFRMAEVNLIEFHSVKSAQIADLMNLEGFDVQLDPRSIERQCAQLDAMKKKFWTQLGDTKGGAAYMSRVFGARR
ncbi:hypothetical protein [Burkholderia gladioli]|uniref:hypothetical protein n=1 Tax=Burkholderia gladioli TaxID=28095 RepID=UPI00163E4ED3|nr:hypothetical protein [Burkholderia gladioli]